MNGLVLFIVVRMKDLFDIDGLLVISVQEEVTAEAFPGGGRS